MCQTRCPACGRERYDMVACYSYIPHTISSQLSHSHSLSHSLIHTVSLSLSLPPSLPPSLSLSLSLSLALTHSHVGFPASILSAPLSPPHLIMICLGKASRGSQSLSAGRSFKKTVVRTNATYYGLKAGK